MKEPNILDLRPAQFSLGMKEVDFKIAKMRQFKMKELRAFCNSHVIPIVLGPKSEMYIIDHHHFGGSCTKTDGLIYTISLVSGPTRR